MKYKYQHAALGGTFDLLHKGHEAILQKTFAIAQKVTIGQTTDNFCKKLGKIPHEDQLQRRKNLQAYLKKFGFSKRAKLIWLSDIFGNTLKDTTVQAIAVSKESLAGANVINKTRLKLKLKKLPLVLCPQVLADDKKPISSTRIRNGEIAKTGLVYQNALLKISQKALSSSVKSKLKKPFGKIVKINSKLKLKNLIAVGDISVSQLLKFRILPKISIVDFYVQRKLRFHNLTQLGFGSANADVIVKNPAGTISKSLSTQIGKALIKQNSTVILVDGEEDLAAIPAILLAPLGYTIVYGQPERGAVVVNIDNKIKESLCEILSL